MSERFMRRAEVMKRTGLPASSLYRLIKDGKFPAQYKLAERIAAWKESEVEAWMRNLPKG